MRHHVRLGVLLAVLPVLVLTCCLTAGCSALERTDRLAGSGTSAAPGQGRRVTAVPTAVPAAAVARPGRAGRAPTKADLVDFQTMADCLRKQGVEVAEPRVGVRYDNALMSRLFSTDRAAFDGALAECPDYLRLVVGTTR